MEKILDNILENIKKRNLQKNNLIKLLNEDKIKEAYIYLKDKIINKELTIENLDIIYNIMLEEINDNRKNNEIFTLNILKLLEMIKSTELDLKILINMKTITVLSIILNKGFLDINILNKNSSFFDNINYKYFSNKNIKNYLNIEKYKYIYPVNKLNKKDLIFLCFFQEIHKSNVNINNFKYSIFNNVFFENSLKEFHKIISIIEKEKINNILNKTDILEKKVKLTIKKI